MNRELYKRLINDAIDDCDNRSDLTSYLLMIVGQAWYEGQDAGKKYGSIS